MTDFCSNCIEFNTLCCFKNSCLFLKLNTLLHKFFWINFIKKIALYLKECVRSYHKGN